MTARFFIYLTFLMVISALSEAQTKSIGSSAATPDTKQLVDPEVTPETNTKVLVDEDGSAKKANDKIVEAVEDSKWRRSQKDFVALFNYSPMDLILPNKIGATVGWIQNSSTTYELEFLTASVEAPLLVADLGKMSEKKISIVRRTFSDRNAFGLSYGIGYTTFDLTLGDDLINRVTSGAYPNLDVVKFEAITFNFSLGHRWTITKNITFGADWFSIAQPLVVTKKESVFVDRANNQSDKDAVEGLLKFLDGPQELQSQNSNLE